ncbi:MAG: hypothetical protein R3C51_01560 [Parvularculaceae bacterium]
MPSVGAPEIPAGVLDHETPLLMKVEPLTPENLFENDRASMRQRSATEGFVATETALKDAAYHGGENGIRLLATFYAAHNLWPETLSALAGLSNWSTQDSLTAGEAEYYIGRYQRSVERLEDTPHGEVLTAMSLTRLGAYAKARDFFAKIEPWAQGAPQEALFCHAEALAFAGDAARARHVLSSIDRRNLDTENRARLRFIQGVIFAAEGDAAAARQAFTAVKGQNDWAFRARLKLLNAPDAAELATLAAKWSGGAFEREILLAGGAAYLRIGALDRAFTSFRRVVRDYPNSDDALGAQSAITNALPRLFADDSHLAPEDAARVFFENVEFSPPGREGDRLIRSATARLAALGLYRQAAVLLHHQTFKRLRGVDRSVVAADLAALYLTAGEPEKALTAIQSTRIAGLPQQVVERRRLIEAQALADTGKTDGAIELLSSESGGKALLLRAGINWNVQRWPDAAADYAAAFSASAAPYAKADIENALRAVAAYTFAGDSDAARRFAADAAGALSGLPEASLIKSLGAPGAGSAEFAAFMKNYRDVFNAPENRARQH